MKTEKQIELLAVNQGTIIFSSLSNFDSIEISKWKLEKIIDMLPLNIPLNIIPILQQGFIKMSEKIIVWECSVENDSMIVDIVVLEDFYWKYSVRVGFLLENDFFMNKIVLDTKLYDDPVLAINRKQHSPPRIINEYLRSLSETKLSEVFLLFIVMAYINYINEHKKELNPVIQMDRQKSEKTFRKEEMDSKPSVRSKKIIRINDDIKISSSNYKVLEVLASKKNKRIADSWAVRGHYRHYRSGKTVYIKPYIKGADKGNRLRKIYKL